MSPINRRHFMGAAAVTAGAALSSTRRAQAAEMTPEMKRTVPVTGRVIDTHMHLRPYRTRPWRYDSGIVEHSIAVQAANYVQFSINIGITGDDIFYPLMQELAPFRNRVATMYALDWGLIRTDPSFFAKAPDMLEQAVEAGAVGIKCFKDLGLTVRDRDGSLLAVDDERLFPVWERAEKLGIVVAFHSTDPVAFFAPWTSDNERWDELELHPGWSFADRSKYPARETILEQRDRVIASFPGVTFQGCHVANNSEDLDAISRRLEKMPNFVADLSARIGELGRHDQDKGHDFFVKFQDRLMFGTDHYFSPGGDMQGAGPHKVWTPDEDHAFYESHWRYFQTRDCGFNHPTPIQGDWTINGIGLDENVLRKVYWENAYKLYRLERFGVV